MKAKIDNYTTWIERSDDSVLRIEIAKVLENSGFTILNFMEHQFEPQGYTAVWLLAESHCALHTFPEENRSYVELSSCNTALYVRFIQAFTAHFKLLETDL
ncbi:MAG: S-adenosylmethionine decarboxylase [Cyclobacteriaceae bacterium]|nr:S-adenosylmethionine decarboxylase [Cyclobacteriaceae bacterium HetDA_MAG_MS6]